MLRHSANWGICTETRKTNRSKRRTISSNRSLSIQIDPMSKPLYPQIQTRMKPPSQKTTSPCPNFPKCPTYPMSPCPPCLKYPYPFNQECHCRKRSIRHQRSAISHIMIFHLFCAFRGKKVRKVQPRKTRNKRKENLHIISTIQRDESNSFLRDPRTLRGFKIWPIATSGNKPRKFTEGTEALFPILCAARRTPRLCVE